MIEFAPISEYDMTYEEAVIYCRFCDHNGYKDWRMPTYEELKQHDMLYCWYLNDFDSESFEVIPVRDTG